MANSDIYWPAMSDKALLIILGDFIRETRLRQNKSQQDIATASGVARSTVTALERGGGGTLISFIKVTRTLDQLPLFGNFQMQAQASPLQLAKLEQAKRQRASGKKKIK